MKQLFLFGIEDDETTISQRIRLPLQRTAAGIGRADFRPLTSDFCPQLSTLNGFHEAPRAREARGLIAELDAAKTEVTRLYERCQELAAR